MAEYSIDNVDGKPEVKESTLNILPVSVNFTGVVPNGSSNWESYKEIDTQTNDELNYLRGRKIVGTSHAIDGYKAVVFEAHNNDDNNNNNNNNNDNNNTKGVTNGIGGDVKYYNNKLHCEEVILFEHQVKAGIQNDQIERVSEWIEITNFINNNDC